MFNDPHKTTFEDDYNNNKTVGVPPYGDPSSQDPANPRTVFNMPGSQGAPVPPEDRRNYGPPHTPGNHAIELAVGWLVAITGPMRGQSHTLRLGRNTIGRGLNNDIVLPDDVGISSDTAVTVAYVPQTHEYYVGAGNGHMIATINDKPILMTEQIKAGDRIRLSHDTVLRFVPCCFDGFFWESEA